MARNLAVLLVGFLCIWCNFAETATSNSLWRKFIDNAEAICNDNSRATFYIGPRSSTKWIVFFESGGFCASYEECNERYLNRNSTVLMTSTLLPDKVTGRDLLSSSNSENPTFYDYTHVLVPYCSSDLWLGLKTNPNRPFRFVNDSSVDNFSFRGHTIFRSVFEDLLQRYNLSKAEKIVLSGSSAGGIGVLNHADWVLNNVIKLRGLNSKLKCIVDSGWFIDFQDTLENQIRPRFTLFANISLDACNDSSLGYPCCPYATCMISRGYYPASVPLLLISSMYDIFVLEDLFKTLEGNGKSADDNSADYVTLVSMYGGAMNESLTTSESQASNLSIFVPACFQHIYLSTSSLWGEDSVLPPAAEFGLGRGKLSHKIQSGTWESTKIQTEASSSTMKDFIATWVQSRGSHMTLIDSCLGAQCNPTCPDKLLFFDPSDVWGKTVQIMVIVLALVITVVSFGLKATFMLNSCYLKRKQTKYLREDKVSTIERELPPCSPKKMINIACLSLSYSVDVSKKAEKGEDSSSKSQHSRGESGKGTNPLKGDRSDSEDLKSVLGKEMADAPGHTSMETCSGLDSRHAVGPTQLANRKTSYVSLEKVKSVLPSLKRKSVGDLDNVKMKDGKPRQKQVLKDVSAYFNAGELVAIMGPSGCGKTTLLDLLTGRRRRGHCKGQVYINGVGLEQVQDWYARKVGYVLQLAVPYYEELTVRQNLFFAAHMRLPKKMSPSRKFERVEQILAETGLTSLADSVVGGSFGGGLSGGQKRRLCVALQMINLPSVLFLDEPTSGLDASSSLELLSHLNLVAESGRLVILTIHQPRLEIFHLFHKILLLSEGQVAYYGEPDMAPAVFIKAYLSATTEEFRQSECAPKFDTKNPADTIMDLLNCPDVRRAIMNFYQTSGEPQAVQEAINNAQPQAKQSTLMTGALRKKRDADGGGSFNRTFVLEERTSERQTLGQIFYFPFIFFMYGLITGTVYFRAEDKDGILLMAAYCVYCCSSPLFLSSVLMAHLNKALDIFHLERADGCGRSYENVIQTYVRTAAVCLFPVIMCSVMSYFLVMTSHDLWEFVLVTIISLVLNQTWIAVYMMVICAQPQIAHRICPMVSAIAGFAGGFLVLRPAMPDGYNLLFYINPQFYGYAAITKILLKDNRLKCAYESPLNCISTDGNAVLGRFGFDETNIYENLAVMLGMTLLSLILAWVFLEMKYIKFNLFTRKSSFYTEEGLESSINVREKPHPVGLDHSIRRKSTLQIVTENEGLHTVKLQDGTVPKSWEHTRKTSRIDRWQSTQNRMAERKTSLEAQMENVRTFSIKSIEKAPQHKINGMGFGMHGDLGVSKPRSLTAEDVKVGKSKLRSFSDGSLVRLQGEVLDIRPEDTVFEESDHASSMSRKTREDSLSKPRILTDPTAEKVTASKSKLRRSAVVFPRVHFQVGAMDILPDDSVFEESEHVSSDDNTDNKKGLGEREIVTNKTDQHTEGNSDDCIVEVEDVAVEGDDEETSNSNWQETRF